MRHAAALRSLLCRDEERSRILRIVRDQHLPDCWIGAGFVRNAVWDHLHGRPPSKPDSDIDVIRFDPFTTKAEDAALQAKLRALDPTVTWSVKNQSRMHVRNNDPPYTSVMDAIRGWPETATAIAVRQTQTGQTQTDKIELAAPFGLDDLFGLIVRPTPRLSEGKRQVYLDRVRQKQWLRRWPRLSLADPDDQDALNATVRSAMSKTY